MSNTTTKPATPATGVTNFKLPPMLQDRLAKQAEAKKEAAMMQQQNEKKKMALLRQAGIDTTHLDQMDDDDKNELEAFLKKIKPELAKRLPVKNMLQKQKAGYAEALAGNQYPALEATDAVVIGGIVPIAGPTGTHGWIMPADPAQIKIWDADSGSGNGWWPPYATTDPIPAAVIKYSFRPDQAGMWNICPIAAFEGYYILSANDTFWTSKRAAVSVYVTVEVKQYDHFPTTKRFEVLHEAVTNNRLLREVRTTEFFVMPPVFFRALDMVDITVTIETHAVARGGGSYAEINFNDDITDYIMPMMVLANPV